MSSDWTKTKIVCTIGPASSSREMVKRLVMAGMNVARLNLAHDTQADHATRIKLIRSVSRSLKRPVGILLDLPGPKIRVGLIRPEPIVLRAGATLILTERSVIGNEKIVSLQPPAVVRRLKVGEHVFLADGTIRLVVRQTRKHAAACRVVSGGPLLSGKGVNLPGKKLGLKALTRRDIELLQFGLENRADFIGLSFTTSQSDVVRAKRIVKRAGFRTWVIAKIETRQGVENFDEIVQRADGVMVARGDLGIEMEVEDVPVIQKRLIRKANAAGKPVVTATQMLESMVSNPTPTRAEVTDIANAIIDGTDAVMLSEETAVGKYPIEAVNVMRKVAAVTEKSLPYKALLNSKRSLLRAIVQDSISFSACQVACDLDAGCIVAFTRAGATAHRVSKFRSPVPIIALTYRPRIMNRLSLLWGVYPYQVKKLTTTAEIFTAAKAAAIKTKIVKAGGRVVVVCGDPSTSSGTTDLLRVETA